MWFSLLAGSVFSEDRVDPSGKPFLREDGNVAERYRVRGDLNCDCLEDMVLSADLATYAQTGIKLYIYLRDTTKNYVFYDSLFTKPAAPAVENYWKGPRLWK